MDPSSARREMAWGSSIGFHASRSAILSDRGAVASMSLPGEPLGQSMRSCSPNSDEDLEDLVCPSMGGVGGLGHIYARAGSASSSTHARPHPVAALSFPSYTPGGDSRGVTQRVSPGKDAIGPMVAINVGGEVFSTTRSTLQRAPFFESMFRQASHGDMGTTVDERGRFFVDRSCELFRYILDYLKTSHWMLKERAFDYDFIEALREEACFFGLDVAAQLPIPPICEYVTIWQFREDAAFYIDCLEQTLREDPDHQGSFRLCKYFGTLPLDAKTNTKRFKASSHSLESVLAYFAMRGWVLKNVVEGSMITHTTSADGQSRNGMGVQYILEKQGVYARAPPWLTPPLSQRADPEAHPAENCTSPGAFLENYNIEHHGATPTGVNSIGLTGPIPHSAGPHLSGPQSVR